jgi:DNA-directed RNA polymerase specialized sigma24 family protein
MMKDHVQFLEAQKDATKAFQASKRSAWLRVRLVVVILKFAAVRLWRHYRIMVAEDAVQETLLHAGRYRDSVKEGAPLRP